MKRGLFISILLLGACLIWYLPVYGIEYDCKAGVHPYVVVDEKAAVHGKDGYIVYQCDRCGDTYTQAVYEVVHQWSDWTVNSSPTCTASGSKMRTCTAGTSHDEEQEIPPLGHSYSETVTQPTCKTKGMRNYTCSRCGDSYEEHFGEPLGHSYQSEITKAATCVEEGVRTYTCANCQEQYTEPIQPLGHEYGGWITEQEAEVGIRGSHYQECSRCGNRIVERTSALPYPTASPTPSQAKSKKVERPSQEAEKPSQEANKPSREDKPSRKVSKSSRKTDKPSRKAYKSSRKEKKPFMAPFEWVITAANIVLWIFLYFILVGEFRLLIWVRRQKKKVMEQKAMEKREEEMSYGFKSV